MNLRCKPGDLAVTVGAPMDNGLIVEVLSLLGDSGCVAGPCWIVRSEGSPFHFEPGVRKHTVAWPDSMLQPIRDPGDDAQDEMLDIVPSPAQLEAMS